VYQIIDMKKLSVILIVSLILSEHVYGQKEIKYGSNNGKFVSIFNTKIYYEEYGKGSPLILLEGGMGSIEDFSACIPVLLKKYRVIAPDMPGQGRSGLADSMSYQLLADYISKFIDVLGLDSCYVMGWSDGGNTALILANNRPDKIRKVLVSGANYNLNGYPSILKDTVDFVREINSPQFEIDAKQDIDNYLKLGPGRDWKKMFIDINKMWKQATYFPASVLEGIKIPVMLVLGDRDAVPLEHGIEMHHLIKSSQFCVLPNTSHRVFYERPALISEIAIDFFSN
jgi:pimeloyl-ACP methyl ester carboxylesterase